MQSSKASVVWSGCRKAKTVYGLSLQLTTIPEQSMSITVSSMSSDSVICVIQVLTVSSSVPPKVSAALSAAEEARCSLEDLLQRERLISNMLNQVEIPPRRQREKY